jgi:hypothetical protein
VLTRAGAPEAGSAPVETVFSVTILLLLALGAVQVAFALYGRNVVAASAHEGARAALEVGRGPTDAAAVARRTVQTSAGKLVHDLSVTVSVVRAHARELVVVRVSGVLAPGGPVPLPIPVSVRARAAGNAP